MLVTSIDQPILVVGIRVAITPFGAIDTGPQFSTLAPPRAGQPPCPIVHFLIVPRHPPTKRLETFFGRGRIEQSGTSARVLQVLSAGTRPVMFEKNQKYYELNYLRVKNTL